MDWTTRRRGEDMDRLDGRGKHFAIIEPRSDLYPSLCRGRVDFNGHRLETFFWYAGVFKGWSCDFYTGASIR